MKVALIGSQTFPVIQCAIEIAKYIAEFPPDTMFLTRGSKGFDAFATECARYMHYEVETYPGHGGGFNFERDQQLAEDADKLVAFFDAAHIGQGGTQHVIDKFLDLGKPVESFANHGRGFVFVGSEADGESDPGGTPAKPHGETAVAGEAPPEHHGEGRGSAPRRSRSAASD